MLLTNIEILQVVNEAIYEAAAFSGQINDQSKTGNVSAGEWATQAILNLEIAKLKMLAEIAVRLGFIAEKIEGA
jgi:hypothetical protein